MEPLYALLADVAQRVRRLLPVLTTNLATAMALALLTVLAPAAWIANLLAAIDAGRALGALGFVLAAQLFACAAALAWQGVIERRSAAAATRPALLEPLVDFSLTLVMVAGAYLLALALTLRLHGYACEARDLMRVVLALAALAVAFVALPLLTAPALAGVTRRARSVWAVAVVALALMLAVCALPAGEHWRLPARGGCGGATLAPPSEGRVYGVQGLKVTVLRSMSITLTPNQSPNSVPGLSLAASLISWVSSTEQRVGPTWKS